MCGVAGIRKGASRSGRLLRECCIIAVVKKGTTHAEENRMGRALFDTRPSLNIGRYVTLHHQYFVAASQFFLRSAVAVAQVAASKLGLPTRSQRRLHAFHFPHPPGRSPDR
jgi:hypothetical protein